MILPIRRGSRKVNALLSTPLEAGPFNWLARARTERQRRSDQFSNRNRLPRGLSLH